MMEDTSIELQKSDNSDPKLPDVTSPESAPQPEPSSDTPADSEALLDEDEGMGMWGWIKSASNNSLVQKVMETTKTSVDRMITTLDPGMTPFMREGGEINIIVTSDKEVKWCAVRDAFQSVFGAATVSGVAAQPNIAPQPVGCLSGFKGAQERIQTLRTSSNIDENQVCVSVENFIAEQLPDRWFDIGCLILQDPLNKIELEVFTLAVPVPNDVIVQMQDSTPTDYDLRWSGLSVTVGEAIQKTIPWVTPSDWHKALVGKSRRDIIHSAAVTLAELYKRRLPSKEVCEDI